MKIIKLPIITIVLLLAFQANLYAQEVVEISTDHPTISTDIKSSRDKLIVEGGTPVTVRFNGLNPLKYRYTLNHSFVSLFSENQVTPGDIYSSFIPNDDSLKSDGETTDSKDLKESLESLKEEKKEELFIDSLEYTTASTKKKSLINQKLLATRNEISEIQKRIDSVRAVQDQNKVFFQGFLDHYSEERVALNIPDNPGESDLENAKNLYRLIEKNSKKLIKEQEIVLSIAKSKDQLDLNSLRKDMTDIYDLNQSNYSMFKNLNDKFPYSDNVPIYESKKNILSNFKKIEEALNLVYAIQDSFGTAPIDYHGENIDFIKLSLGIIPIDSSNSINRVQNYDYKIWIKGGVKIDFSAGLFVSSLKDNNYLAVKDETSEGEDGSLYRIIEEENGDFEFGIGSTVNFTSRGFSTVRFGGSVGGFVTSNQKFRLVAGPTFTIGKMERLIFGFGVVMGEIESLSNQVNLTGSFDLGDSGSVPTVQKFETGYYFSFTYNLGKPKAKD